MPEMIESEPCQFRDTVHALANGSSRLRFRERANYRRAKR
jgi:hypothetical protein